MNVLARLEFGLVIAFFLPGSVSLYALGYLSPPVAQIFQAALSEGGALGASFLILIGSLVVGIVTSSFRALTLDWLHKKTGAGMGTPNYRKLLTEEGLSVFNEIVNNTYRYYQFYGNTFISLIFLLIVRYTVGGISVCNEKFLFVVNLIALLVLFLQSRNSSKTSGEIIAQTFNGGDSASKKEKRKEEEDQG